MKNPNFHDEPIISGKEKEIDLKEIFTVIKRRFWMIAVITILTTFAAGFYSFMYTSPLYATSTRIALNTNAETLNTLNVIIKDPAVLEKVSAKLKLNRSGEALSGQINVETIGTSQVINISVIDSNAVLAADIANTIAEIFQDEIPDFIVIDGMKIMAEAKPNYYPINENHSRYIMMGVIAGIIIGVGLVFLLDSLDDSIRSKREVEEIFDAPILGAVSKMSKRNTTKGNLKKKQPLRSETIGSKSI
ncbi:MULTISPECIES: YveK family protein [Bacillaceae]|uniref:YveK family protein n=1 Tax=Bacillaceae TaxID=186817 RepID=UPI000C75D1A0|nr:MULTISPECIES: Wzz/FepE/Etk N-terminal domain-containing protein [Bacillaceae]PLR68746.1 capsular biosynthesis protein [Bacillus sp. UMB0893]QNG58466.1 capsular biosynthesis protein [Bacillus sp. PAMC26568]